MNHSRIKKTKKELSWRKAKSAPSRANVRSSIRKTLKQKKFTEADYKKQLDALLQAKEGSKRIEKSQIEMTASQSSQYYLILLQLVLMGAEKLAKEYSKKAKYDYSKLRREAMEKAQSKSDLLAARKVGSRRVSKKKVNPRSLTLSGKSVDLFKKGQKITINKIKGDRKWYETNQPGGVDYTSTVKVAKII